MSYGDKPNEIFLQYYGFVDTSYASDFYTADLVEYVQQKQGIPADRLTTLGNNQELLQAVESVSVLPLPLCFHTSQHQLSCIPIFFLVLVHLCEGLSEEMVTMAGLPDPTRPEMGAPLCLYM